MPKVDWNSIAQQEIDRGPGVALIYPGEPHLACIFLLDTSGSMAINNNIDALNGALARFKNDILEDDLAARRVDTCLISFNSRVEIVQDFVPAQQMLTPVFTANGGTSMGEGILTAIERAHMRNEHYDSIGVPHYKPFILMITDGAATDNTAEAANAVHQAEQRGTYGHLRLWAFAVKGASLEELTTITKRVVAVEQYDFSKIFDWASSTMKAISRSRPTQEATVANLPTGMIPVVSKTNIPAGW